MFCLSLTYITIMEENYVYMNPHPVSEIGYSANFLGIIFI